MLLQIGVMFVVFTNNMLVIASLYFSCLVQIQIKG